MKGLIFTEFIDMIEEKYGLEMADYLINTSELPSKGAYTAVGTYNHHELFQLVGHLSEKIKIPPHEIFREFGKYLFFVLAKSYQDFLDNVESAFDFLSAFEIYIHVEVQKLYPDAELPHLHTSWEDENTLILIYHSERKLADFAYGLIESCLEYYQENAEVRMERLSDDNSKVKFIIKKS
ncbi:heme NO-binding domain-containing protein [Rapidithrix thailandica]|uniref:Heme NO-binding domain-containing protein n=1 Tax=Rapidithrix thailandica TaxID=413964 RepID=A0AAW9SFL1_9BACT